MASHSVSLFDRAIMTKAVTDSLVKLDPRKQLKNPVMFVTLIGAILSFEQLFTSKEKFSYVLQIALWLLFSSPTHRPATAQRRQPRTNRRDRTA